MKRIAMVPGSVALLALALVVGWQTAGQSQTKELVVAAWGDPYEAGWRKSLVPAFEKQHDAKIVWVQGFSSQTLAKLRAQKDSPQIDVAMMDDGPHRQAAALGLVEKLDRGKLANVKDLYEVAFEPDDLGIGFASAGYGLYYDTKAFADNKWAPPTSWTRPLPARAEGQGERPQHRQRQRAVPAPGAQQDRRAAPTTTWTRASPSSRSWSPHVVTFDKFGETPTLIQQGQTVIGTWNIDRVVNLAATGVPVKFVGSEGSAPGGTRRSSRSSRAGPTRTWPTSSWTCCCRPRSR